MDYKIEKLNETNLRFLPLLNQPFDIIGRFIPTFDGEKWACSEALYTEISRKTYKDEEINPKDYTNSSERAMFLAVRGDICIGTVRVSTGWLGKGYIDDINVNAEYRRKGVGKKLMDSAVNWCRERGLNCVTLETQDNNLSACRFYVQYGFELCGIDTKKYAVSEYENETALYFYMPL